MGGRRRGEPESESIFNRTGDRHSNFGENGMFLAELETTVPSVRVGTPAAPTLDVVLGNEVREQRKNAGDASAERVAGDGVDTGGTDISEQGSKEIIEMGGGEVSSRAETKHGGI